MRNQQMLQGHSPTTPTHDIMLLGIMSVPYMWLLCGRDVRLKACAHVCPRLANARSMDLDSSQGNVEQ